MVVLEVILGVTGGLMCLIGSCFCLNANQNRASNDEFTPGCCASAQYEPPASYDDYHCDESPEELNGRLLAYIKRERERAVEGELRARFPSKTADTAKATAAATPVGSPHL